MKTSLKNAPIKQCIDLALEKANSAVNYDTSNDFHNAIAAYTEAVELLVFVLQHPSNENNMEGLKSIVSLFVIIVKKKSSYKIISVTFISKELTFYPI
jgi:nitrate/nitrite-specific signal transduction histidine kinase